MKFCMSVCWLYVMSDFGLDHSRAERMAFYKPSVMTTELCSKSNGSTDFDEILLECVFTIYYDRYWFCF